MTEKKRSEFEVRGLKGFVEAWLCVSAEPVGSAAAKAAAEMYGLKANVRVYRCVSAEPVTEKERSVFEVRGLKGYAEA